MPSNPRLACVTALLEWQRGKTYSDEILHDTLAREPFTPHERGFFMEIFFGVLRHMTKLDFLITRLREDRVDPRSHEILRLGLYQLWHMRVASHAAVNETVSISGPARGLVNAILRRALREKDALDTAVKEAGPEVEMSHPDFLIERWEAEFGPEATQRLMEWNNTPAEVFVRANEIKATVAELLSGEPEAKACPAHPLSIRVRGIPPEWLSKGVCYVQDPSTLIACDLLAPQPGETVLDACAAPGGKTTYLAQLMHNEGRIIACDLYESRVARLKENIERLGVTNTTVLVHDCMQAEHPAGIAEFDRILVDAPCSNTGVIRRRVDVRWRLTDEDFMRMPAQQLALLRRAAAFLKPGGTLVYSTCSLEPEENEQVVERALAGIPGLRFLESRRALPFVDNIDGAFAAKFIHE